MFPAHPARMTRSLRHASASSVEPNQMPSLMLPVEVPCPSFASDDSFTVGDFLKCARQAILQSLRDHHPAAAACVGHEIVQIGIVTFPFQLEPKVIWEWRPAAVSSTSASTASISKPAAAGYVFRTAAPLPTAPPKPEHRYANEGDRLMEVLSARGEVLLGRDVFPYLFVRVVPLHPSPGSGQPADTSKMLSKLTAQSTVVRVSLVSTAKTTSGTRD
jgi:hypothetical protein